MVWHIYPSKHFVYLQDVFKTSSRHLQRNSFLCCKTFWRYLEDALKMSHKYTLQTTWTHLEDISPDVLKTSSRRLYWRSLEDVLEDKKLLHWRRVGDAFKTFLEDVFKMSWRPTNVCWVVVAKRLYL